MLHSKSSHNAEPCIWMTAGLLTYKLCDRSFDCERCPLDAAFRPESPRESAHHALTLPCVDRAFPDDRLYSTGHLWVQQISEGSSPYLRLGLDAFAAAVIGFCRGVRCELAEKVLHAGETVATVDLGLGVLSLGAPIAGTAMEENPLLRHDPAQVLSEPYGSGWILHLAADARSDLGDLLSSRAAREQAMCDLRHLRRRVALQLLAEESGTPSMADGGEMICDLREILGGADYLLALRELIH